MIIGELAELAKTTPRTVRHYHREGLLPEPPRRSNGYRSYGIKHLIQLVKIRRLREVGLSVGEIRGVIEATPGSPTWREAMITAEARLAEQERRIRILRRDLARQLASGLDPTLPAPLAKVLDECEAAGLTLDYERESALVTVAYEPALAQPLTDFYQRILDDPQRRSRIAELNADFLALAALAPDDPAVAALARALAVDTLEHGQALLPEDEAGLGTGLGEDDLFAPFAPAQRRAIELMLTWLADPERGTLEP